MSGISKFFIDRPIFAAVISIVIVLAGTISLFVLPIAQYPEITPPTVEVRCFYPGANAQVVSDTVASPIEQQIIGVERMLYMSSSCGNDGTYTLTVTFEVGTKLDDAQVQVQNRVNLAMATLPDDVKKSGVNVKKKSPNILLVVNMYSPDGSKDQLYLSNYTTIYVQDELKQLAGVGDTNMFGQQDYSMRVWLDPDKVASRGLTAPDVANSLREQNVQVAAGALGQPPTKSGQAYQYTLTTLGRLTTPEQFAEIIIRTGDDGEITRLRDVVSIRREVTDGDGKKQWTGGIELGSKSQDTLCTLDGKPAVGVAVYQLPGSNALQTADRVRKRMEELKASFSPGVDYKIVYDTTPFIEESVAEVNHALRDAVILVAIVVLVFLQTWRATVIPLAAVPVAIVGTLAVMLLLDYSLNNLTLLGLVLAIGIVVDDAIVVVEAVEHKLEHNPGMSPKEATRLAMDEVAGPIVAISLVLMAVFIPCAFITGISGQFFRQFAVTIAVSTFFSCLNSLTLSPALCGLVLKPRHEQNDWLSRIVRVVLGWFFRYFNLAFGTGTKGYAFAVKWLLRLSIFGILVYGGLLVLTYESFTSTPVGFVPAQDKGYLLVDIQLPDAASQERTLDVVQEVDRIIRGDKADPKNFPGIPGVAHTITIPGFSLIANSNGSNFGTMFVILENFHDRPGRDKYGPVIAQKIRAECFRRVDRAQVGAFGPPAVDGLGNAGGFKLMVRDRSGQGLKPLQAATDGLIRDTGERKEFLTIFTTFRSNSPQMFVDVDRSKCKSMGIPLSDVFATLQVYLGGFYVNDFNQFGRTWQVKLQADQDKRVTPDDVKQLKVRNSAGDMVPIGSIADVQPIGGPVIITRYNGVTAAAINGATIPGLSTGDMIKIVDETAAKSLPPGMDYQWTELTFLQIQSGNTALLVFALSVVLVYLLLAAQYESLRLPLAVILVVPMCLLCSVIGVNIVGLDMNIFVQIGFIVLVGLASKNAILIVEFAKEQREKGMSAFDAALEACKLRLRPILMTSLAFIFGVVPLMLASGAGAELRKTLGIAVFSGMLGVTVFGIFLTPIFYYVLEKLGDIWKGKPPEPHLVVGNEKLQNER